MIIIIIIVVFIIIIIIIITIIYCHSYYSHIHRQKKFYKKNLLLKYTYIYIRQFLKYRTKNTPKYAYIFLLKTLISSFLNGIQLLLLPKRHQAFHESFAKVKRQCKKKKIRSVKADKIHLLFVSSFQEWKQDLSK